MAIQTLVSSSRASRDECAVVIPALRGFELAILDTRQWFTGQHRRGRG